MSRRKHWEMQNTIQNNDSVDSVRCIANSLLNLADNLAKGPHKCKCKDRKSNPEYMTSKYGLLTCKCVDCNKSYEKKFDEKKFDEDLSKRFKNTCQFCNGEINKFFLMLQKGVYPNEYMHDCEKFNETLCPVKEEFYSSLTMESVTYADWKHPKRD